MADRPRIADEKIAEVVKHANFGGADPVETVKNGLLQRAADYGVGATVTFALIDLGLISASSFKPTALGRRHLWYWFSKKGKDNG